MRLSVLIPTLLAAPVLAQSDPTERVRREAESFTRACVSPVLEARQRCELDRAEFVLDYLRARAGEYLAQRNVASHFARGNRSDGTTASAGGVIPDLVQACAWRLVIIEAEHLQATPADEASERRDCNRLEGPDHEVAQLRAAELNVLIATSPVRNPPRRQGSGA
jgi:hypothetical protein